jgi:glycosyltransferase
MSMKITIITVAFNSQNTIADTLRSVAMQSHANIEHIVIDGLSEDNTLEVLREHGEHVHTVVSERDSGIYDAMNKGLRLASGDLVGFLNADDLFAHRDVVANIARAAEQDPAADAVFGDIVYVRADRPGEVIRHWRSGEFTPSRLRFGWMPPHPTFYVRVSKLALIGEFDATLRIAADYDFMLRSLAGPNARAVYIRDVLVRMRAGGVSNRSLKAMLSKSREDLWVIKRNRVGGLLTLLCKNARKVPQFFNVRRWCNTPFN